MFSFIKNLFGSGTTEPPAVSPAARDFLAGRTNQLSAADIDPVNTASLHRYEHGMRLKQGGDLAATAALLAQSCQPPSIYKGHYCELFKVWRAMNRDDLKAGKHAEVAGRVTTMIRLDDEMITEMLRHWGERQRRLLPPVYFDRDRNLLKSDAKALLMSAKALGDNALAREAEGHLARISARSASKIVQNP